MNFLLYSLFQINLNFSQTYNCFPYTKYKYEFLILPNVLYKWGFLNHDI